MTIRGLIVTLLELVLLVFALGTEMHEFLIVALCVGVLEVYSFVSTLLASLTLNIHSKIDKSSAERLEGAKYILKMRGIALLPVAGYLSIKNADYEDKKLKRRKYSFVMLPSFIIEHKFDFPIPCAHIGLWEVGVKKLRIEDLFGLFSLPLIRSRRSAFYSKLSVVPQVHELRNDSETNSMGDYGQSSMHDSEQGELLGDSRLYREGDTLKRINWKLSARTKTLYSRQFEMLQNPKIAIAVDSALLKTENIEDIGDFIDITCEAAISIAKYYLQNKHTVDIVILRDKGGNQNLIHNLTEEIDIKKMQYNFSFVKFYTHEEELDLTQQDNLNIMNADKIFLISSNPSDALLSDFYDLCNTGKLARCIIPSVKPQDVLEEEEISGNETIVKITDVNQIGAKVGAAL